MKPGGSGNPSSFIDLIDLTGDDDDDDKKPGCGYGGGDLSWTESKEEESVVVHSSANPDSGWITLESSTDTSPNSTTPTTFFWPHSTSSSTVATSAIVPASQKPKDSRMPYCTMAIRRILKRQTKSQRKGTIQSHVPEVASVSSLPRTFPKLPNYISLPIVQSPKKKKNKKKWKNRFVRTYPKMIPVWRTRMLQINVTRSPAGLLPTYSPSLPQDVITNNPMVHQASTVINPIMPQDSIVKNPTLPNPATATNSSLVPVTNTPMAGYSTTMPCMTSYPWLSPMMLQANMASYPMLPQSSTASQTMVTQASVTSTSTMPPANSPAFIPLQRRRPIIIDGMDLATAHALPKKAFSPRGISLCVDFFKQRGHTDIVVFLPHTVTRTSFPLTVLDPPLLRQMEKDNVVQYSPSRVVDRQLIQCSNEIFILELAHRNGGVVVSNRDFNGEAGTNSHLQSVVAAQLLGYCLVQDYFMPAQDPLGRYGPKLDQFLVFPPLLNLPTSSSK